MESEEDASCIWNRVSENKDRILSILMFPWIAHGHIFPYLELAKNLSRYNFQIHFCSTPINLKSIKQSLTTDHESTIRLVELHLPSSPELPPELHTTKNTPPHLMPKLHEAFHQSKSNFTAIISSLKPDVLIYDCFQPWAASTASSLGIPAIHFAVASAAFYAFYYHLYTRKDQIFPFDGMFLHDFEQKAFDRTITAKIIAEDDQDRGFAHFKLSQEFVLIKTCNSLEDVYMDYLENLSERYPVAVGSLIAPATNSNDDRDSAIMKWLSGKKRYSTVFISFGSENYLGNEQMHEVAKGLEACDVNFIWVVRFPRGEREAALAAAAVPEGFLERVGERGMIVEWAPQDKILAHPSTGAFVSHCGWNSTLESIRFGVPVIAIPFKIDQPLNARLMMQNGVAVEVVRDENGNFSGGAFAAAVNEVVGTKGEEMRASAAAITEEMKREEETAIDDAAEMLRMICIKFKHPK